MGTEKIKNPQELLKKDLGNIKNLLKSKKAEKAKPKKADKPKPKAKKADKPKAKSESKEKSGGLGSTKS